MSGKQGVPLPSAYNVSTHASDGLTGGVLICDGLSRLGSADSMCNVA